MKVVFLDIDGVLQPYDSNNRFYMLDNSLVEKLSKKHGVSYAQYSIYDVMAVYYDWDTQAIERLRYILEKTRSKIIVSSDWRSITMPNKMLDLLRIHNLDKYWFKDNIINEEYIPLVQKRALEIKDSLLRYPIDNFVILDDMEGLEEYFKDNTVITKDYIGINDMERCIKILTKK